MVEVEEGGSARLKEALRWADQKCYCKKESAEVWNSFLLGCTAVAREVEKAKFGKKKGRCDRWDATTGNAISRGVVGRA